MASESPLQNFSNELEDAGLLGLAASSMLGVVYLSDGQPGAFTSTDKGFVWTKETGGTAGDFEAEFGIGTLKFKGARISATLAVTTIEGIPSHIDILFSVLGDGPVTPSITLDIDPAVAVLADKVLTPDLGVPEDRRIVAYDNVGDILSIPLPMFSFEFSFRLDEKKGLQSSIQFYSAIDDVAEIVSGIFEFDLQRVIVFPALCDIGLYVDNLVIDLSSTASSDFDDLYPEVYEPQWKGFAAKSATLLVPIDADDQEFIAGGVHGFMLGLDGGFSSSINISYARNEGKPRVRWANIEVEIRNNEFVKSAVEIGFHLDRVLDRMGAAVDTQDLSAGTERDHGLKEKTVSLVDDRARTAVVDDVLVCRLGFVWHEVGDKKIMGFDIIAEGFQHGDTTLGFEVTGERAREIFWTAGLIFGVATLAKGFDEGDDVRMGAGICLQLLVLADMIVSVETSTSALPELQKLLINKAGLRFVRIREGADSENYFQIISDFRLQFEQNGVLIDALVAVADFLLTTLPVMGNLFGRVVEDIKLEGTFELELSNVSFHNKPLPEAAQRLFEQHDFQMRALKLPVIKFNEGEAASSSLPLPIVRPSFITRNKSVSEKEYGIGIYLEGLASADFVLDTPAAGFVLFFWPDWDFKLMAQMSVPPKFTFVIPGAVLAEGVIELNKPLPSFGGDSGELNRISLDVGALPTDLNGKMSDFLDITKYDYRFGGTTAWGEARYDKDGLTKDFDFCFVEVHYAGKAPLIVLGAAGIYGLGAIFGKNIRPGVQSSANNAMGIANWIIHQRDEVGTADEEIFKNVSEWPAVPAADGSTWHPAIDYDASDDAFRDQHVVGLTISAGSVNDAGETCKGDFVVLVGFPEFLLAIGGVLTIKAINGEVIAVIVYDRNTFAIKLVLEIRVDEDGSFFIGRVPLEFGTQDDPSHTWLYLGHYLKEKGNPATLSFLKNLFTVKAYIDYDSDGLPQFGLAPIGDFPRPDLPGPAIGVGVVAQFGPKKYGPSAINIKIFAALGLNVGYSKSPRIVFGEIFAGGYIALKVLVIKTKLELLLALTGMSTDEGYDYKGIIYIKLNMPWPIPDFKTDCEFNLSSSDTPSLPEAVIAMLSSALSRAQAEAKELTADGQTTIPIDGSLALAFEKPVYEVLNSEGGGIDRTQLLLNDENPNNDITSEQIETDYDGERYIITYVHTIESISVTRRPLTGGDWVVVDEIAASWDAPHLYKDGEPDPQEEMHHVLYLNALFPPHLKFATQQLGKYNTWKETREHRYPCYDPGLVCINHDPRPEVDKDKPLPEVPFSTDYGPVVIRQDQAPMEADNFNADNAGDLAWDNARLVLPLHTHFDLPLPDYVKLSLELQQSRAINPRIMLEIVEEIRIECLVKLRGRPASQAFAIIVHPGIQTECGWRASLADLDIGPDSIKEPALAAKCQSDTSLGMNLILIATNPVHRIDAIKIRGHSIVLKSNLFDSWDNATDKHTYVIDQLKAVRLVLRDVCIQSQQHSALPWKDTLLAGDTPELAADTLTNNLLLEPNHEYRVECTMRAFGTSYHIGENGSEVEKENEKTLTLNPIRFRTEAEPSADVAKYVGFTFPAKGMQAPYPDALTPLIGLINNGLIKKIYRKHYGSETLHPRLVDIDEQEIAPVLNQVMSWESSSADTAVADLLTHCLPDAEDYVKLELSIWERSLAVDTRYSLQLRDTHLPEEPRVPYTISFRTSRYQDLIAHVQYLEDLFPSQQQQPLLSSDTVEAKLQATLAAIAAANRPGFDAAIEQFYLDFLGVEGGRLGPSPSQDYVANIVGLDAAGEPVVWAVVIELVEPVFGKEGVKLDRKPSFDSLADKGITVTAEDLTVLRDRSGSRLIVFNSHDANSFQPFTASVDLRFEFHPKAALRIAVAQYVAGAFADQSTAEQESLIDDQMTEITSLPHISQAMQTKTATLKIHFASES